MPSSLKVGPTGATYYISDKGKKVYADKVPGKKKPKKQDDPKDMKGGGKVHPTHGKKVAAYKAKGQATGEKHEGNELFIGGKGNHFYVSPKTGKKVIFTKKKSKELGFSTSKQVGGGNAKPKKQPKKKAKKKATYGNGQGAANSGQTFATEAKKKKAVKEAQKKIDAAEDNLAYMEENSGPFSDAVENAEGDLEMAIDAHFDAQNAKVKKKMAVHEKTAAMKKETAALKEKNAASQKALTKKKKQIEKLKEDLHYEKQLMYQPKGGSADAKKLKAKIAALEGKTAAVKGGDGKAHPKEKKYASYGTDHSTAGGQRVYKGKGGNYFTVHPKKGTKQMITKKSAKEQGFHSGGKKTKSGPTKVNTKAKYNAASKNFKPLKYKGNQAQVLSSAAEQVDKINYSSKKAIQVYTGNSYEDINGGLRNPPPDAKSKQNIKDMDKGFKKLATEHDYEVFRGTSSNNPDRIPELGGVYEDKGFSSTSFRKKQAESFEGSGKHKMLMTIEVPKGSRALAVDDISYNEGEEELLIDRGAKMRIVGKKKVNGVWHIRARLESTRNQ